MKKNTTTTSNSASNKVYQIVTDRIIAKLEAGNIPWVKSYYSIHPAFNRVSGKIYSGVNRVLLEKDGEYATFKQWQELGGKIKKGAKSEIIISWAKIDTKKAHYNDDGELEEIDDVILRPRYYNVFHISQVEGVEPLKKSEYPKLNEQDITDAEDLLHYYWNREGIKVEEIETNKAFYSPSEDRIQLRSRQQYVSMPMFYRVAFHESVHSTGHKSRLDRLDNKAAFGDDVYSKEELVAELGSAFIMAMLGLETEETEIYNAKYIESWLQVLKNDNKMIVQASARAEKAVSFILKGYKPTGTDDDDKQETAPAAPAKSKKNVIPRNARILLAELENYGQMIVRKDSESPTGWRGVAECGKNYNVFSSHLRNAQFCTFEVLDESDDMMLPDRGVDGWLHFDTGLDNPWSDVETSDLFIRLVDDDVYEVFTGGCGEFSEISTMSKADVEDTYGVMIPFDNTFWKIPGQMSMAF